MFTSFDRPISNRKRVENNDIDGCHIRYDARIPTLNETLVNCINLNARRRVVSSIGCAATVLLFATALPGAARSEATATSPAEATVPAATGSQVGAPLPGATVTSPLRATPPASESTVGATAPVTTSPEGAAPSATTAPSAVTAASPTAASPTASPTGPGLPETAASAGEPANPAAQAAPAEATTATPSPVGAAFSAATTTSPTGAAITTTSPTQAAVSDASKTSPAEFKSWQKVQRAGSEAFEYCQYGKAERLLKEAVEKARNIGPGDPRIAKSPGDLGRLLTVRARFSEAQPYLEEEFYLKYRAVGNENGEIVSNMEDLIRFYLLYGSVEKAEPLTQDLLNFVQGKFAEQAAEIAAQNKVEKGGPLIGWAGTAQPAMRDPLLEWAISCDKLGELYRVRGNYAVADQLFKTALDVKATVLGKKHLSLASSYDSLGSICLAKNEKADAESYFKDALEITQGVLESGDPQIYARMDKLATCYIAEGKYPEAEAIYLDAIRSWGHGGSIVSGVEQRALYSLGCFYSDRRRFASAAPVLRRVLRMSERTNGVYSVQLVPILRKYAYVVYYLGNKGEGQNLQARANFISPVVKELKATIKIGRLQ